MMLFSRAMIEPGGITYTPGSLTVIGNDGAHFNMAIGTMPNAAASATLAYALEHASDHLPITSVISFDDASCRYRSLRSLRRPPSTGPM